MWLKDVQEPNWSTRINMTLKGPTRLLEGVGNGLLFAIIAGFGKDHDGGRGGQVNGGLVQIAVPTRTKGVLNPVL